MFIKRNNHNFSAFFLISSPGRIPGLEDWLLKRLKEKLKSQQGNRMSDIEVICFKTL